ncbi:MAG TPA: thiamine pyrophosphate-dependent enzyme [Acidobacteriaceae bacterium]
MATNVREQIAVATPNPGHPNPLISHEKLRHIYRMMLQSRLLDERVGILEKQAGFEGDRPSSSGLEATAVGAAIDLRIADTLASSHRDFLLSYLKGEPLVAIISQLFWHAQPQHRGGLAPDDCGYATLNDDLPTSTVAAQLNMCTHVAIANQQKNNDNVVMFFSGEGSVTLNPWQDALHFAGQRSLPIVFVRNNKHYPEPVLTILESTRDDTNAETVAYGFPRIAVDGKDAVAVYRVAYEAIERARSGGGPTLIDAQTLPEYGFDEMDRAQNRATDEIEKSESQDPIAAMERYLTGKGLFSKGWKSEIIAAFQQELNQAMYAAEIDSCGASA